MMMVHLPALVRLLQGVEFPHKLGIMDRFFANNLASLGICWVKTAAGRPWKLDLSCNTHRWIVYGKYEGPGFHRWAKRILPRNAVIVDSGANIGQMLVYLVNFIPEGRLFAFEPGAVQGEWLEECLRQNPGIPVEMLHLGLGAATTTVLLHDDGDVSTHGGQSMVSETEGTPIQIVRLDDELARHGVDRVDLWKLDVEGYEIPALEGARPLLEKHAIGAIYAELHAENGERIKDYLAGFGYRCHSINDHGTVVPLETLPEHTNGLFLPPNP